jgi:hypothetical protein
MMEEKVKIMTMFSEQYDAWKSSQVEQTRP